MFSRSLTGGGENHIPAGPGAAFSRSTTDRIPRVWWVVAGILLGLRLALLVLSVPGHGPLTGDETVYDRVARNLLAGLGYTHWGGPWVFKPPGWPLALAGIYGTLGDARRTVVLFQGLFDSVTILTGAWLAWRIERRRAAFGAAFLLIAIWPPYFRESRFMQTEPLFTACVALTLAAFARLVVSPGWKRGLVLGLAAGAACLVRPTGLVPLVGLVAGWLCLGGATVPAKMPKLAAIALGLALALLPWTVRNAAVFRAFIPVSTGSGELFFMGTAPETDGRWIPTRWVPLVAGLLHREEQRLGHRLDPMERDRVFLRKGFENWRRDPAGNVVLGIKRLARLCLLPVVGARPLLRWGFLLALVLVYALAIARIAFEPRRRDPWGTLPAIFLFAALLYALASSVFYTNSRYFEPARLMILIPAAGSLAYLLMSLARRFSAFTPQPRMVLGQSRNLIAAAVKSAVASIRSRAT